MAFSTCCGTSDSASGSEIQTTAFIMVSHHSPVSQFWAVHPETDEKARGTKLWSRSVAQLKAPGVPEPTHSAMMP